jgi:hypothetical protein
MNQNCIDEESKSNLMGKGILPAIQLKPIYSSVSLKMEML